MKSNIHDGNQQVRFTSIKTKFVQENLHLLEKQVEKSWYYRWKLKWMKFNKNNSPHLVKLPKKKAVNCWKTKYLKNVRTKEARMVQKARVVSVGIKAALPQNIFMHFAF